MSHKQHTYQEDINRNAQVQVWLAPLPIHSCVGAIANRGQWEQGCRLFMATDLGPVRTTREKKKKNIYPALQHFQKFTGKMNNKASKNCYEFRKVAWLS